MGDLADGQEELNAARPPRVEPALAVMAAGVCAALHVGKLAPAIPALQQALGLSLVQAGFLLSMVQAAGMAAGLACGVLADGLGPLRSMRLGLFVLAAASLLGGAASDVGVLMLLRAAEGFGFLLAVLPAPGLLRLLVPPQRVNRVVGAWGSYMPFATALAMLAGPAWMDLAGWRAWWWLLGGLSLVMAVVLPRLVPMPARPAHEPAAAQPLAGPPLPWRQRMALTLASRGPWLLALTFAMYSAQWLAVVGFLPSIYAAAGMSAGTAGLLSALAAGVNIVGNVASGRLLQRGVAPPLLLGLGFTVMAAAAALAYAGPDAGAAHALLRYLAVLVFSMVGGLIPGTLFALAVRLAPDARTVSSTVGWMQQWLALGQFAGPPLVAWVASRVGGWHWTWVVTGACSLAGLWLTGRLARLHGH